ncbi:purine-cytosine permease family protein [Streptomyces catenulae]|uniref:Cytosine permease n=1 Tax=Streptomyces catenulae TaxID=66875 RepID=A0ABV2YSB7_9ACTN|nr:cytosine permease [Streptomyces catenulae]
MATRDLTATAGGPAATTAERAGQLEAHGIDHIPDAERHGRPRELFAVWAAPNVSYLSLVVGATLVLTGLTLGQALAVIAVGNLLWILTGVLAVSGPAAGTTGSVVSRAMYGVRGNKAVIALTGWLISAAYLALNWSAASVAGIGLAAQLGAPGGPVLDVAIICAVAAATLVVAVYGHATIVRLYAVLSIALTLVFVVVGGYVLAHTDWSYRPAHALHGGALWTALAGGFALIASTPLSYGNSPDLARYLPRDSSPVAVAGWTALGAYLPSVLFTALGALAATGLDMSDPQRALEGILPPWFVPVFVTAVICNTVANNGLTAYSAGLTLQSIGVRLGRVPAVLIIGVLATAMTLYALLVFDFLTSVNTMLELVVVVTGPAVGVYVADIAVRRNRYDGPALLDESRTSPFWYDGGVHRAGVAAFLAGSVAAVLAVRTSFWTGPVAALCGDANLSLLAGLLVSAAVHAALGRPRAA